MCRDSIYKRRYKLLYLYYTGMHVRYVAIMLPKEGIRIHFSMSESFYNLSGLCSRFSATKQTTRGVRAYREPALSCTFSFDRLILRLIISLEKVSSTTSWKRLSISCDLLKLKFCSFVNYFTEKLLNRVANTKR